MIEPSAFVISRHTARTVVTALVLISLKNWGMRRSTRALGVSIAMSGLVSQN